MKTTKKPSKAQKPKQVRRAGTVVIDHWDDVMVHVREIAKTLSQCEHDLKPLTDLLARFYLSGFSHGLANGLLRGRQPRARKVRYQGPSDLPQAMVASCLYRFVEEMEVVHAFAHRSPGQPSAMN